LTWKRRGAARRTTAAALWCLVTSLLGQIDRAAAASHVIDAVETTQTTQERTNGKVETLWQFSNGAASRGAVDESDQGVWQGALAGEADGAVPPQTSAIEAGDLGKDIEGSNSLWRISNISDYSPVN
jgi:streptogramin lyase